MFSVYDKWKTEAPWDNDKLEPSRFEVILWAIENLPTGIIYYADLMGYSNENMTVEEFQQVIIYRAKVNMKAYEILERSFINNKAP